MSRIMKTYQTKNGTVVVSELTTLEAVNVIEDSPSASDFARSLANAYRRQDRRITYEQEAWIHVCANQIARASKSTVRVGDLSRITELLQVAKRKLKYPKFRVLVDGIEMAISESKNSGELRVTSAALKRWSNKFMKDLPIFYGTIKGGSFRPTQDAPSGLKAVLQGLADDPETYLSTFGKLTGRCSMCGLPLSDPRSVEVGYGETCAKHYGLPWGNKVVAGTNSGSDLAEPKVEPKVEPKQEPKQEPELVWNPGTEEFDGEDSGWYDREGNLIYFPDDPRAPKRDEVSA